MFRDRLHAGKLLSAQLREYADKGNVALLALPAGGVPVGHVVAKELGIARDVIIVRKVQIPWNTEAGFGAVAWDGVRTTYSHQDDVQLLNFSREISGKGFHNLNL